MQDFAVENAPSSKPARVVEAELRLPKAEELHLPKVNTEPVRKVAEEVLLVSLGLGVLAVRGLTLAIKAAYKAGNETIEHPGPVTQKVLDALRGARAAQPAAGIRRTVPVLPIENYDVLAESEVIARLSELDGEALRLLRQYETDHARRTAVLEAIARRLELA
jgi:hypothetical protein